jgi:hypothetical protein
MERRIGRHPRDAAFGQPPIDLWLEPALVAGFASDQPRPPLPDSPAEAVEALCIEDKLGGRLN